MSKNDVFLKEKISHGTTLFPMNIYSGEFSSNNFNLYLHWHNEMEFIYIKSGEGNVYIDMNLYNICKGDFIMIRKDALHYLINRADYTLQYESIVFDLKLLQSSVIDYCQMNFITPLLTNNINLITIIKPTDLGYLSIISYFNKIIESFRKQNLAFQLEIKGFFLCLFSEIFSNDYISSNSSNIETENKKVLKLKKVINYININYNKPISIKDLAVIADYSEYHFIRFFKTETGKTCVDFINSFRIEKASNLLKNTTLSVTEISFEVGYENVSYFIKLFKKFFGLSPSVYRKSYLSK